MPGRTLKPSIQDPPGLKSSIRHLTMKHRPAAIHREPASQRFGSTPRITFMLRIGSWMVTPAGIFRWTRYDFTTGGKPQHRHDWRKLRLPFL